VTLNRAVYVVVGLVALVMGGWLFAGIPSVVLGLLGKAPLSPMLVFAGVAMPALFVIVATGIFWVSFRLYIVDRAELRAFMEGAFEGQPDPADT